MIVFVYFLKPMFRCKRSILIDKNPSRPYEQMTFLRQGKKDTFKDGENE